MLDRNTPPIFKQVDNIHFFDPVKANLSNNIPVNYLSGGSQDIIKVDFIFKAGIWNQSKPLIASTTSKLLKEGTKNYSAFEIAEGIDYYGAFLETETSFDSSSVTLYTLNKHLKSVLPYVYEVITSPSFSEKEFNTFKINAIEKFKVNSEKVSFVAQKEFRSLIFGDNHPYGSNPTIKDYNSLSLDDIKTYHKTYYQLSNCEIIISGKVEEQVVLEINKLFGNISIKQNPEKGNITTPNIPSKKNTFIEKENALQSAIKIGRLIPNKLHEDYFGLRILNTVLGGYFGSRLMSNIREDKGYTYGIGSGIISLKNSGYFVISTEVGSNVTKDALKEIYKEIELLRTVEISEEELDLVKNYLLGQILKSCDGPFNMAALFESVYFYNLDYSFYNEYIKTIKEISPKTFLELANKYFKQSDFTEIVVGNL